MGARDVAFSTVKNETWIEVDGEDVNARWIPCGASERTASKNTNARSSNHITLLQTKHQKSVDTVEKALDRYHTESKRQKEERGEAHHIYIFFVWVYIFSFYTQRKREMEKKFIKSINESKEELSNKINEEIKICEKELSKLL